MPIVTGDFEKLLVCRKMFFWLSTVKQPYNIKKSVRIKTNCKTFMMRIEKTRLIFFFLYRSYLTYEGKGREFLTVFVVFVLWKTNSNLFTS